MTDPYGEFEDSDEMEVRQCERERQMNGEGAVNFLFVIMFPPLVCRQGFRIEIIAFAAAFLPLVSSMM
jgi:hypothetical protein